MSPSVNEMQNETYMCVVATPEHGLDLVHSVRKAKSV